MRGFKKSKRVTWASDVNLCQVRLFLSEESPSQVGAGVQDHLQAKASWMLHSTGMGSDDSLPPGFEGTHPSNQCQINMSEVPLVKWMCPPKFMLDSSWQVVAGEESVEVEHENQREMRVLEAVYPRVSAIPLNPNVSMEVENLQYDGQETPIIPITPIEDEDLAVDFPPEPTVPFNYSSSSQTSQLASGISSSSLSNSPSIPNPPATGNAATMLQVGVQPDVEAAASVAFSAIMESKENGSMIDHELLINILGNPKLLEKLVTDYNAAPRTQNMPNAGSSQIDPPQSQISRTEATSHSSAGSSGPFYPQPQRIGAGPSSCPALSMPAAVSSPPPIAAPLPRDINYYKSLIQQHGEERQEPVPQFGNRPSSQSGVAVGHHLRPRDQKPKIMKPCIYFNSSRGCRNGANCAYQHDVSFQQRGNGMPEVQNTKRMKMDR